MTQNSFNCIEQCQRFGLRHGTALVRQRRSFCSANKQRRKSDSAMNHKLLSDRSNNNSRAGVLSEQENCRRNHNKRWISRKRIHNPYGRVKRKKRNVSSEQLHVNTDEKRKKKMLGMRRRVLAQQRASSSLSHINEHERPIYIVKCVEKEGRLTD